MAKENKKEIRNIVKKFRADLSVQNFNDKSNIIYEKIINSKWYQDSDILLIYVSFRNEADTHRLISHSIELGKKVAVPKIIDNTMYFYYINSLDELSCGFFGVLEPSDNAVKYKYSYDDNAVIIVPGLAFSISGQRLGYGGGFYDKYLSCHEMLKVGICFKEQIYDTIPCEEHDITMDRIITD